MTSNSKNKQERNGHPSFELPMSYTDGSSAQGRSQPHKDLMEKRLNEKRGMEKLNVKVNEKNKNE